MQSETPLLCCVFILKIRPGVFMSIALLWLAAWALECVKLVFDWPVLWNRVPTVFCGRGWPQGPAYHSTNHSLQHHRRETQNWPWIKVTGSFRVFPQKCLISNLWPLSFPLFLSLSLNPQFTLFPQFLKESVSVMGSTVQFVFFKGVITISCWCLLPQD